MRKSIATGIAVVSLSVAALPVAGWAQTELPSPPTCFRGRPLPRCGAFWITEAGYHHRLSGTRLVQQDPNSGADLESHVSWELGRMRNRDSSSALGWTILIGVDAERKHRLGAKARFRRWLDPRGILDLSGGVLQASVRAPYPDARAMGYGLTGDAAVGWSNAGTVTVGAEALRSRRRNVAAVYGGVRLSAYPAVVATTLFAVATTVILLVPWDIRF